MVAHNLSMRRDFSPLDPYSGAEGAKGLKFEAPMVPQSIISTRRMQARVW